MNFQTLSKPSNRWTLALIVAATAITGTTVFYGIPIRPTSKPSEPVSTAPTVRQVTALGRLEPAAEVIQYRTCYLSNDRVAKLLVQRGDRVEADRVIAIMDPRARLQNAFTEAQAQVKVSRQSWQQLAQNLERLRSRS